MSLKRAKDLIVGYRILPGSFGAGTNSDQVYLSLFQVLIMEALVLGGQHGSEKTMGNTASPPCVCCETQIGGGACGFLPHHTLPPAAIKVASLISPSISSFLGLTHSVPLSLICDDVGGLGCSMVQNMFELWLKFDCRILFFCFLILLKLIN